MFPLGGKTSVFGYSRPAVRKNAKFFSSGVDHRLDREDHAGLHDSAGAELAVMADLRIFVETDSDPVTAEFTNDAAALRFDKMLNCIADISEMGAGTHDFNAFPHGVESDINEVFSSNGNMADGIHTAGVAVITVFNDGHVNI